MTINLAGLLDPDLVKEYDAAKDNTDRLSVLIVQQLRNSVEAHSKAKEAAQPGALPATAAPPAA